MTLYIFTKTIDMAKNSLLEGLRQAFEYPIENICAKTGIEESHYNALESGEVPMKIKDAQNLALLYKIEPEIFLQQEPGIINNNIGKHSKGVIYANNYYEGKDGDGAENYKLLG